MINKINHFALTGFPMVHDEEALSALELLGQVAAKINACIDQINRHGEQLTTELDKLPGYADNSVTQSINNGTIRALINDDLMRELRMNLTELNNRLNAIIISGTTTNDNTELVDTRTGADGTVYTAAGDHVRAIATGNGFADAVRPGTVEQGRIMPGMMGGGFESLIMDRYTIPFAGKWNSGSGYYDKDTLELTEHTGYKITDPIPCRYGDMFRIQSYIFGPKVRPAVVFNAAGVAIEVLGLPGNSSWEMRIETVGVSRPDAASISFIVGSGYTQIFRAQKYMAILPDQAAANAMGYYHMHAKNRTDTITDRAQIKMWYRIAQISPARKNITIPVRMINKKNLRGWSFRVFGASASDSYDVQLSESAAAYSYEDQHGIIIHLDEVPTETAEGQPIHYLCVFLDFIALDPEQYMDVWLIPPTINGYGPMNADLHGALDTDHLNMVPPNAAGSRLYQKTVLGVGDSLMAGNTLRKSRSWLNVMGDLRDMHIINEGLNGSPVGNTPEAGAPASMRSRMDAIISGMGTAIPDYAIITGGANDKRLNVSLNEFTEALTEIVSKIRSKWPRCKIMMGTNWRRTTNANTLGLYDQDYVSAMIETGETLSVPVVNNYADGINLLDPATAEWADEGLVSKGEANIHFSVEANKAIAEAYVSILETIN